MIRKETFTTADKWVKPTKEEIVELLEKVAKDMTLISKILDVSYMTISRCRCTGNISYSTWALLALLAGKGDITRPNDTEEDLEEKIKRCSSEMVIYRIKLAEIERKNKIKRKLSKKL